MLNGTNKYAAIAPPGASTVHDVYYIKHHQSVHKLLLCVSTQCVTKPSKLQPLLKIHNIIHCDEAHTPFLRYIPQNMG